MLIGVPKEIKVHEYRVGMTPAGVREAVRRGHAVRVETGAGAGIGLDDAAYRKAGASIAVSAAEVFAEAELIVKVKEPQPSECSRLRAGQTIFTYLHLAPDPEQARGLLAAGCTAIAYETVTDLNGRLPLLAPMSEVAGRMAAQMASHYLEKTQGGRGVLLGGVPGVRPANVVILGGGVVGTNAAKMAAGMGASVTILDVNIERLRYLDDVLHGRVMTLYSNADNIAQTIKSADAVIGAVLLVGAKAPNLIRRDMLRTMPEGSVIVDVAVDQGGCVETTRPTTHSSPTYVIDGVVHYGVANMPGAVPRTSSLALSNATLRYVLRLADLGAMEAMRSDPGLAHGLNIYQGQVTHPGVAEAFNLPVANVQTILWGDSVPH